MGKGSGGEGDQETCAGMLWSSEEAERRCRHSKNSKGAEEQKEAVEGRKEAAAGFCRRTGFPAPSKSYNVRCICVAADGDLSGKSPLEKRGIPVLQGRMFPKLH